MITRRVVLVLPALALGLPSRAALSAATARAQSAGSPLAAALALEHEAVHTFGELGARLDDATKELVRALDANHRQHRDRVTAALRSAGETPAAALPAYSLPIPVGERASALEVLLLLEEALVRAYTTAVRSGTDRALAGELLGACASHLTVLRFARARSLVGSTDAFPGQG
ncbi:MAG TPA: DUF4439 domain-containing protein [Mycobacteriales bacterium]|nr:DUF4439 domain-containing protein [Mycobacteriales bacterium]